MEIRSLLLWMAYFLVIWTAYEVQAHPKSWLTTTKPRSNTTIKPRPKIATKTRIHTTARPRPKRSVTDVDVTFFPGPPVDIKDESRELRMKETEAKVNGEEEVFIRLLQEEEQSNEDSDEYSDKKRVTIQMKTPRSEFQGTLETIEIPSDIIGMDFLPEEAPRETSGRDYVESTTFSIPGMESEDSKIDDNALPNELIPSLINPYDLPVRRHFNDHSLHHDTDVNLGRTQDTNFDNRQASLLRRLLSHPKQIAKENLDFLKENEEESTNIINRKYEPASDVISEAQLNWEEYHEYDA